MLFTIIKFGLIGGFIYGLYKYGLFKYITNKVDIFTKTTKEFKHNQKIRGNYLKKMFKHNKKNNEI